MLLQQSNTPGSGVGGFPNGYILLASATKKMDECFKLQAPYQVAEKKANQDFQTDWWNLNEDSKT